MPRNAPSAWVFRANAWVCRPHSPRRLVPLPASMRHCLPTTECRIGPLSVIEVFYPLIKKQKNCIAMEKNRPWYIANSLNCPTCNLSIYNIKGLLQKD